MKSRNDFVRYENNYFLTAKNADKQKYEEASEQDNEEWLEYMRWYYAGEIMAGFAANSGAKNLTIEEFANDAVALADALISRLWVE